MIEAKVFERIIQLAKAYPWNSMLQVRIVYLMERIISSSLITSELFRSQFLTQTQIIKTLADMGDQSTFELDSGRCIRNGYMGLVVKVSNTLLA